MVGAYGWGLLTQCLALADEAQNNGHTVAFLCEPALRAWPDAEGYTVFPQLPPTLPKQVVPTFFQLADAVLALGLADKDYIRASVNSELRAVRDFRPDILVSNIKLSAPISARIANLPLVSTAMWADHPNFTSPLYENSQASSHVVAVYNHELQEYKQIPIRNVGELSYLRSDLKIAASSPELDPELNQVENLHYVGHLLYKGIEENNVPKWLQEWDPSDPMIYVYLSISDIGPDIYTEVLPQAFDGTRFHVVVSAANHPQGSTLPQATSNVRYVDRIPGLAIMRKSKLVIHHGGTNTAMAAVLAGVPTLMFPGRDAERESTSRNIARVGCGKLLPVSSFTPQGLTRAIEELFTEISLLTIQDFAARLKQLGGPKRAWELIEKALN
jgi:MGT family glycosyltransferase